MFVLNLLHKDGKAPGPEQDDFVIYYMLRFKTPLLIAFLKGIIRSLYYTLIDFLIRLFSNNSRRLALFLRGQIAYLSPFKRRHPLLNYCASSYLASLSLSDRIGRPGRGDDVRNGAHQHPADHDGRQLAAGGRFQEQMGAYPLQ